VIVAAGSDALSGINKTEYRLGNGSWVTYTMPLTISSEGVTTVTARSVDNAGNKGAESTAEAKIVKSPPTTPVIILQSGGWTPGPVAFEITGSTGYGDFKYEYSIDDGPFTEGNSGEITKEGTSTITARAVNIFGQQSAENNEMVTIDHTEPTVNVTPNGHDWSSEAIKVDVTVSDDLSGIKPNSTYYKITSSPEQPHDWEVLNDSEIVISAEGQRYIHVKATDNAGNTTMYSNNSFKIQNQPVAPVGVKAINVQNDQVTVSWDLPDGSIYTDGYVYELTNNTTGATFQKVYPENSATD
ncbi:OmpL47-type beta-barrel domain-containing protein, partial [Bacillus subtilis]|uniref:OmpL47-type beta-barrel domain-containing protein n=1 Tax=Bacillus subtilis TaxID=1423 RepID=UPI003F7BBA48